MPFKSHLARFIVVGCSNMLVSMAVFEGALDLLPQMAWQAGIAQALSYSGGICWSFVWNRNWTFASQGHRLKQSLRFLSVTLAMLCLSSLALHILVDLMRFQTTICWIAVMAIVTLFNFVLLKTWVFGDRSRRPFGK